MVSTERVLYSGPERRIKLVKPGQLEFKLRADLCGEPADRETRLQKAVELLAPRGLSELGSRQMKADLVAAEFHSGILQVRSEEVFPSYPCIDLRPGDLTPFHSGSISRRAAVYSALVGRLGDPQEVLAPRAEVLAKSAAYVSLMALFQSRPHYQVIVNTGALKPLEITHEALAREIVGSNLSRKTTWHVVSIEDILRSRQVALPAGATGLLVTGYSSHFLDHPADGQLLENEQRLQFAIREVFYNEQMARRCLSIIVLSETLPHIKFDGSVQPDLPWNSGPFQPDTTWSIEPLENTGQPAGFSLVRQHLGYKPDSIMLKEWTRKDTLTYDNTSIHI